MISARALMDRLAVWRASLSGMSRADRARWAACASVADVARCTAAWLRGEIRTQPGYLGPTDVDGRLVRGLAELLARVNEAGFLTSSSQAGVVGDEWTQFAAVCGYVGPDELARLSSVVRRRPELEIVVCRVTPTWSGLLDQVCPVTFRRGYPVTDFGQALPERDIRETFDVCRPAAVEGLVAATQVVVLDRFAGRNEILWPALAEFAGGAAVAWLLDTWARGHERPCS